MTSSEAEKLWVQTFVARDRRERFLFLLGAGKRAKAMKKLSHQLDHDLDPRFVFDKEKPPPEVALQIKKVLDRWKHTNPAQTCYIITHGHLPHEMMNLQKAQTSFELTFGAIIILIPDVLAYYHTERSNIDIQPFYVLFHPVNAVQWLHSTAD